MGLTWSVSIEYQHVDNPYYDWANIFHNTIGSNMGAPGTRTPAIYTRPGSHAISVMSYINGDANYVITLSPHPKLYEWYKILVEQQLVEGKYIFSISVNDNEYHSVENTTPQTFYNVDMWVSDPWYAASPGIIRNLRLKSGVCK